MSTVDSIFRIVIFHICMSLFESTLISLCKPQSKLDLPTLHIYIDRKIHHPGLGHWLLWNVNPRSICVLF